MANKMMMMMLCMKKQARMRMIPSIQWLSGAVIRPTSTADDQTY